jgi:protein-S-isoprenylcysteine O-methyltransferase Ste14
MNILGIGPLLAIVGAVMAAIVFLINRVAGCTLGLPSPLREWAFWIGMILLLVGVYFWISAAIGVRRAFESHQLAQTGVFGLSRNPMYAGFVVFIIPGFAFVLNDLLLVFISLAMYFVFKMLVGREEGYLAEQFGEEFERYRKSVPQLIPFIHL